MVFYERGAKAISIFVAKNSGGAESVDKAQVIALLKERAESLSEERLVNAYAKGFADSAEKTLTDQSVIKVALSTSTIDVINKTLEFFTQNFQHQIEKEKAEFATKQLDYLATKAASMQSIYFALGTFAAFLIIVFLSIIIKMERNLRHLENKPIVIS